MVFPLFLIAVALVAASLPRRLELNKLWTDVCMCVAIVFAFVGLALLPPELTGRTQSSNVRSDPSSH